MPIAASVKPILNLHTFFSSRAANATQLACLFAYIFRIPYAMPKKADNHPKFMHIYTTTWQIQAHGVRWKCVFTNWQKGKQQWPLCVVLVSYISRFVCVFS